MIRAESSLDLFRIPEPPRTHKYFDRSQQFQTGEAVYMGKNFEWSQITGQTKRIHISETCFMTIPVWEEILLQAQSLELIQVTPALKVRLYPILHEMCDKHDPPIRIKLGKLDTLYS